MKETPKLYEKALKPEYYISEKNIKIIEENLSEFHEFYLSEKTIKLVDSIVEESIGEIDFRLNWGKIETGEKRWFLMYVLYPIHKATTYKEILKAVYNQHSMNLTFRNTILLMFDLNHTGEYPKKAKAIESLDVVIKRKFKNFSNRQLVAKANRLPDFCWDDEGHEIGRREKASKGKFKTKMQGNKLIILNNE